MSERAEERRVTPAYQLEFIDTHLIPDEPAQQFHKPSFKHRATVPYKDSVSGADVLLVISSDDEKLVRDMHQSARYRDDSLKNEDALRASLERYSSRLPIAEIVYGERGSRIECQEPSCKHHVGGGCTNGKVMIQDDCPGFQWCMTYEPGEEI